MGNDRMHSKTHTHIEHIDDGFSTIALHAEVVSINPKFFANTNINITTQAAFGMHLDCIEAVRFTAISTRMSYSNY